MKLNILSDLHLRFSPMDHPATDADLVILAGDIARPKEAITWATGLGKPVLYVPGNHEFYGGSLDGVLEELRRLSEGTRVRVLSQGEALVDGVRFLGTTLWTDFELFDDPQQRAQSRAEAVRLMYDFSRIRLQDGSDEVFTPEHSAALFRRQADWLSERLALDHRGPTVVITHHSPSPGSIHPRFADSLLNSCFVSRAEHLLQADRTALWIHGHTHNSFDYRVNGVRIVCNSRGYCRDGVPENPDFDPGFLIEL